MEHSDAMVESARFDLIQDCGGLLLSSRSVGWDSWIIERESPQFISLRAMLRRPADGAAGQH